MVTRCVCSGVTFADMLRMHRELSMTFEQIKDQTGACDGCTSCEPYVRLTLSTGVTRHDVLAPDDVDRILRSA